MSLAVLSRQNNLPVCRTKNINFIGQTLDALVTNVLFHGTYAAGTLLLNLADPRKVGKKMGSSKYQIGDNEQL